MVDSKEHNKFDLGIKRLKILQVHLSSKLIKKYSTKTIKCQKKERFSDFFLHNNVIVSETFIHQERLPETRIPGKS